MMGDGRQKRHGWDAAGILGELMKLQPWFVLAMATQLTAEQWAAVVSQQAIIELRRAVTKEVWRVLRRYPCDFAKAFLEDIVDEVMCKLAEGTWVRRYQADKKHPMPYLIGSAFNYAQTTARSYWRRFGRDRA